MSQSQHHTSWCKAKEQCEVTKRDIYSKKAEKALINERVRVINNTINMFNWQVDICIKELKSKINREDMEECYKFIEEIIVSRHLKTFERQKDKFQRLWQKNTGGCSNTFHSGIGGCSNINTFKPPNKQLNNNTLEKTPNQTQNNNNSNNWIKNLSNRLLTQAQEKVLSHRPNFAIVRQEPLIGEYIAQVEKVCQNLKGGEAEELRGEIKIHFEENQPT